MPHCSRAVTDPRERIYSVKELASALPDVVTILQREFARESWHPTPNDVK
jgi:hypothetical protein